MLVSIVVPTYNSARYLDRCLASVLVQTYEGIELIVADRGSTDDTVKIANRYGARIVSGGRERSEQTNGAVDVANGEYIFRVDSDFILDPGIVEECVRLVSERPEIQAVVVHNSPDPSIGLLSRVRKFEVDMYKYDLTHSAARFIERCVFQGIGGYDPSITAGEDYDLQNRLNRAGVQVAYATRECLHIGEQRNLWVQLGKYYRYGGDFLSYLGKNKEEARSQLAFGRSIYWRNRHKFLRHPAMGVLFLGYHTLKYLAGGLGVIEYYLRRSHVRSETGS